MSIGSNLDSGRPLAARRQKATKSLDALRVITPAIISLRVLQLVAAKFDLETLQLDAVNASVHADLDETVYMQMPPGYHMPGKQGKVLKLNKARYGLRRSLLLWQQKLTNETKKLGFKDTSPQEPCIVQKDNIIYFFYVEDIVFAFKEDRAGEVMQIVESLQQTLRIKADCVVVAKGIHHEDLQRICSHADKSISYYSNRYHRTPAPSEHKKVVFNVSKILHQRKVGSLLFLAIATRPDTAFAVSRLSRFNQRPGKQQDDAADRVFHYLFRTQDDCIRYGGKRETSLFLSALVTLLSLTIS